MLKKLFFFFIYIISIAYASESPVTTTTYVSESSPTGAFWVSVHLKIQPGWHLSAQEERKAEGVDLRITPAAIVEEQIWSPMEERREGGTVTPVYENEAWLFLKVKDVNALKTIPLSIDLKWVACNETCQIGEKRINISFPNQFPHFTEAEIGKKREQFDRKNPPTNSIMLTLLFAFLGGLILNLMPCVFPVLSLKVIHLLQLNTQRLWSHGVAFTVGVIACFVGLASVLLALRGWGSAVGWGFQLQHPWVIISLCLIFTLLALNLFGVFEIGIGATRQVKFNHPLADSFMAGLLTCFVATPCTAPFMGTALGVAFVQDWPVALLIFVCLGIGVSFPFLLLTLFPAFLKRFPKPGPWMVSLKQFLGFPLLGTVVWLLWVLSDQLPIDSVMLVLAALVLLALGAWSWAHVINFHPYWVTLSRIISLIILSVAIVFSFSVSRQQQSMTEEEVQWLAYSDDLVEKLRQENRVFFIDFTARWCITCQINKKNVLDATAVKSAFRKHNVVLVRADWTKQDARIAIALDAYGRQSVPLYVLQKGKEKPVILPQLLTQNDVLLALEKYY